MRQPRRRSGWRQTQPDPAKVGPLLRDAGFIGSEADPISVRASFDRDDRLRRVHARYAAGWTCVLHMTADGSYSLSQSLRLRATGRGVQL